VWIRKKNEKKKKKKFEKKFEKKEFFLLKKMEELIFVNLKKIELTEKNSKFVLCFN
jgi:hypothetical protein